MATIAAGLGAVCIIYTAQANVCSSAGQDADWSVIRPPPVLDHIPLYSPVYGGVEGKGLVTCCLWFASLSLALSPFNQGGGTLAGAPLLSSHTMH